MTVTDKKTIRRVQILDIIMMCLLYMIQACIFGFVMSYLLEKGMTSAAVGSLNAGFAVLAAFLQPTLGRISDRSKYFDWKKQLQIIAVGLEILAVLSLIFQGKIPSAILFGLFLVSVNCMNPFVFASPFYYERFGISINFGRVRALGSVSYALMSYIMGLLITRFGIIAVPYTIVLTSALFSLVVWLLRTFDRSMSCLHKCRFEIGSSFCNSDRFLLSGGFIVAGCQSSPFA
jgi:PPP family 3-phenylpropionic acid transporter